tara:strand:+ start:317 stop:550 length:234 start_codon:yes stop_codon:yes gene_type:complete
LTSTKLVLNAAHILEYLKMVSPTEEDLIKAVRDIRLQDPTLARAKVLKHLKDENGWEYVTSTTDFQRVIEFANHRIG